MNSSFQDRPLACEINFWIRLSTLVCRIISLQSNLILRYSLLAQQRGQARDLGLIFNIWFEKLFSCAYALNNKTKLIGENFPLRLGKCGEVATFVKGSF